jgi:hypothetical protein
MRSKDYLGYTVYSDGRIKSNGERKVFLKGYDTGSGYDSVKLNGKNFYRHKVISACFIGERQEGYTVNHIDGNKMNNDISNLEYITREDNYKHALDNNLKKNIGQSLTEDEASDLVEFYYNTKTTMQEIANMFGFACKGVVSRLIKGNYTYNFKRK